MNSEESTRKHCSFNRSNEGRPTTMEIGEDGDNPQRVPKSLKPPEEKASPSAMEEFLSGLPSYDASNFSQFNIDPQNKPAKKPDLYLPTVEHPSEQVIVCEKSNVLLRYLHQQWDKKNTGKKREVSLDGSEPGTSKRRRLDSP